MQMYWPLQGLDESRDRADRDRVTLQILPHQTDMISHHLSIISSLSLFLPSLTHLSSQTRALESRRRQTQVESLCRGHSQHRKQRLPVTSQHFLWKHG